jgi:hypothetical protein
MSADSLPIRGRFSVILTENRERIFLWELDPIHCRAAFDAAFIVQPTCLDSAVPGDLKRLDRHTDLAG